MNENRPLYWHEGLFLRPQHFQQQHRYDQEQRRTMRVQHNPYFWGVSHLVIQESRLNNQVLSVELGEFYFPDGTYVKLKENAQIENRSFENLWGNRGDALSVYLGLRHYVDRESNLTTIDTKLAEDRRALATKRYAEVPVNSVVSDLYQTESQEDLSFLNYKLQLFFGDEISNAIDFDTIKIAELKRVGSEVRLSNEYIPPVSHVNASPVLRKLLKDAREQLIARSRELSLYKNDRMGDLSQLAGRDLVYLLALRSLNRQVSQLYHMLEQDRVSPFAVYLLLQETIGELSSFSTRFDLFGLDADQNKSPGDVIYQHGKLYEIFNRTLATISALLDEITAGPDYAVTLRFDGTYHYSDLDERIFRGNNKYYLCARTQLPEEYVVTALTHMSKVSSRELLPLLIARSLAGVAATYLPSPPTALPRRSGNYYFELDPLGDAWSALREGRNVAVYMDNPPADIEFEMMVING